MRLVVVVNTAQELVATQSTAMLIEAATRAGHTTHVVDVDRLGLGADDRVRGQVRTARPAEDVAGQLAQLRGAPVTDEDLSAADAWLLRTNPGRDPERAWAHRTLLDLARVARDAGVLVRNDPDGLLRAATKLYLARLPREVRPASLVTADEATIRAFLDEHGECVVKPLAGTRGQGVFRVAPGAPNLSPIVEAVTRDGMAIVQPFLPDAEAGDLRLVLLDGTPLEREGHAAAIRRRPAAGDFRSNLHAGGRAEQAVLTDAERAVAAAVGPCLRADGLWLVGLDLIGAQVIEVNVFSTGGFHGAQQFGGVDLVTPVIDALAADVRNR